MPTPRAGYFLADGTKVPSVTTILGRFKESGALMQWAFKQGQSGAVSLYEQRDKAADIGTVAHAMVEAHLTGGSPNDVLSASGLPAEGASKASTAFLAFLTWETQQNAQVISAEAPMISERHRYGGTPDLVMRTGDGRLAMADIKTSNGIYREYLIQVAAYALLWDECHPDDKITGGFHLLRFGKEAADFEHRYFAELADAADMFLLLRRAYELDLALKKRAG